MNLPGIDLMRVCAERYLVDPADDKADEQMINALYFFPIFAIELKTTKCKDQLQYRGHPMRDAGFMFVPVEE